MVTTFGNSEWVTQAEGTVQSKSATSCAGMTAHLVLLAQTRVGFLSGGRSKHMRDLPHAEFLAQLEEAYARATVALTRAKTVHYHGSPGYARTARCGNCHWVLCWEAHATGVYGSFAAGQVVILSVAWSLGGFLSLRFKLLEGLQTSQTECKWRSEAYPYLH